MARPLALLEVLILLATYLRKNPKSIETKITLPISGCIGFTILNMRYNKNSRIFMFDEAF
jgi:hypothetical protein